MRPEPVLQLRYRVNLVVIMMKGYSTLPISPKLEPRNQMQFSVQSWTPPFRMKSYPSAGGDTVSHILSPLTPHRQSDVTVQDFMQTDKDLVENKFSSDVFIFILMVSFFFSFFFHSFSFCLFYVLFLIGCNERNRVWLSSWFILILRKFDKMTFYEKGESFQEMFPPALRVSYLLTLDKK